MTQKCVARRVDPWDAMEMLGTFPLDRPARDSLPDTDLQDVRVFMRDHISSYEELEVLVYLARRQRKSWSAADVGVGARLPTLIVVKALDDLRREGLVDEVREGNRVGYTYWPATPELARAAERFVAVYEANPVDIIQLMSSNALERVRSSAAIAFAEAFVIRRR